MYETSCSPLGSAFESFNRRINKASLYCEVSGGILNPGATPAPERRNAEDERKRYAVNTLPQNERSVVKHLDVRQIESFLPARESSRIIEKPQRVKNLPSLIPDVPVCKNPSAGEIEGTSVARRA